MLETVMMVVGPLVLLGLGYAGYRWLKARAAKSSGRNIPGGGSTPESPKRPERAE